MVALISTSNESCGVWSIYARNVFWELYSLRRIRTKDAAQARSCMVALISTSNESCGVWSIYARNVFWELYGDANLDS